MGRKVSDEQRKREGEKMQSTKRHNRTDEMAMQKMSREKNVSKHKMNETEMKSDTFFARRVW